MESLKILLRQFEDGAQKYPGLIHVLVTWPKPDSDAFKKISRTYGDDLCGTWAIYFRQRPSDPSEPTKQIMHWVFKAPNKSWDRHDGACRFFYLARQAGQILIETDRDKHLRLTKEYLQNRVKDLTECWLLGLHELGLSERLFLPRTVEIFSDWKNWSRKRRTEFKPTIITDLFCESALVCGRLLEKQSTYENAKNDLSKAKRLAYHSYEYAIKQKPELVNATDNKVYDWLKEYGTGEDDYELPYCETWKRQVRAGRKHHGTQKNTPRAGRTSRSIVTVNQIKYTSSQKAD